MKNKFTLWICALLALAMPALADTTKDLLDGYVKVGSALAADDFAAATKAGADLSQTAKAAGNDVFASSAQAVASSVTLKAARQHFKTLSQQAIPLAKGKEGYYVMTCPMVNADWVQNTKKVANPYAGKEMPECGSIKQ